MMRAMPVEPPPSPWDFPPPERWPPGEDLICGGGDLAPGTLLAAYRAGLFPMPVKGWRQLAWWSPDPRAVLPVEDFRPSRSLRRSCRRYEVRIDTCFADVVHGCADPRRPHGWISPAIRTAYGQLHALGWAHSVEVFDADGTLAGGLYGVQLGGLFAAESKFHVRTDASKVAVAALVERMREAGGTRLLDVQWRTDHLATLGVVEVGRAGYLRDLARALVEPPAL
jgi:leucyl/phenylalanyl-tRNA--protein transferase